MANHKSALKRVKQNEKRRARNKHVKTRVRNHVKAVRQVVTSGEGDANATLAAAIKEIDKAASKGVFAHSFSRARILAARLIGRKLSSIRAPTPLSFRI